jgi:hypothetical protein
LYDNDDKILINKECYEFSEIDTSSYGKKILTIKFNSFVKKIDITITYRLEDVEDYQMYSSTNLNLREGPGIEFDIIDGLKLNDKVLVTHKIDNEWVKIIYKDKEYFCSENYLMEEKKNIILESFDLENSLIVFNGNISDDKKEKCISMYKKIPKNIINAIRNDGYVMWVSDNPYYTEGHCGTFYFKKYIGDIDKYNKICTYAKSIEAIDIAFLHEVGHWVDNYLGHKENWFFTSHYIYIGVTSDPIWIDIYNEEVGKSGYPSWANNCPEEYFAESFWKVLTEPSWVQKTLPKTYDYMINCINRI